MRIVYIIMPRKTKKQKGGYMYSKSRSASKRDVNKKRSVQTRSVRAKSYKAANRQVRKG
jgi:hypothetical protein